MVSGSYFTQNLKFCVFAGDFEISTLIGDIKIRSKEMMFSVVVNFEALNNFLPTVRSGTTIVTSRQIKTSNDVSKVRLIDKRSNCGKKITLTEP